MSQKTLLDLLPDKEIVTPEGYRWFVYSPKQTGLMLVCLEDQKTGVIVTTIIANPEKRIAAHRAWAGARHSRAPGPPWIIMHEMGEKGVDPDQKLDDTFRNYGHKSVGDMARLEISTHMTPMHLNFAMFNNAVLNGGQEKSTRYQSKFGQAALHPIKNYLPDNMPKSEVKKLEDRYQGLGQQALGAYLSAKDNLRPVFTKFYKPEVENKSHQNALESRVMDCARFFLPFGVCSGFSMDTSARDWSRIISELSASPIAVYQRFGTQIKMLFTPSEEIEKELKFKAEAPSLIRHSDAQPLTNNNLGILHQFIEEKTDLLEKVHIQKEFKGRVDQDVKNVPADYSEGEKLVAQYLLSILPGAEKEQLLKWIGSQKDEVVSQISKIIFNGHNHNIELPLWAGTTGMSVVIEGFLGEIRDWNRHRAFRRFAPLPGIFGEPWTADAAGQILARGYGLPLYLTKIPQFAEVASKFEDGLKDYYQNLFSFVEDVKGKYELSPRPKDRGVEFLSYDNKTSIDYSWVINLLPMAHQMDLWMHGDPKQYLYMTHLRVRPGGHINYRDTAYRMNKLVVGADSYLEGLGLNKKPDPKSREEFFDRG